MLFDLIEKAHYEYDESGDIVQEIAPPVYKIRGIWVDFRRNGYPALIYYDN